MTPFWKNSIYFQLNMYGSNGWRSKVLKLEEKLVLSKNPKPNRRFEQTVQRKTSWTRIRNDRDFVFFMVLCVFLGDSCISNEYLVDKQWISNVCCPYYMMHTSYNMNILWTFDDILFICNSNLLVLTIKIISKKSVTELISIMGINESFFIQL